MHLISCFFSVLFDWFLHGSFLLAPSIHDYRCVSLQYLPGHAARLEY